MDYFFNGMLSHITSLAAHLPEIMKFEAAMAANIAKLVILIKDSCVNCNNAVEVKCGNEFVAIANFYLGNYLECYRVFNETFPDFDKNNREHALVIYLKAMARVFIQVILIEATNDSLRIKYLEKRLKNAACYYKDASLITFCHSLSLYYHNDFDLAGQSIFQDRSLVEHDRYCYTVGLYVVASCLYQNNKHVFAWQIYSRAVRHNSELLANFPRLQIETAELVKEFRPFPQRPYNYSVFFKHQNVIGYEPLDSLVESIRSEQLKKAATILQSIVSLQPDHQQLDFYIGLLFHLIGNFKSAVQQYGHLLKTDPNHFRTAYNREIALIQLEEEEPLILTPCCKKN